MRKNIIVPLTIGTLIFVGLLIFGGYALVKPSEIEAVTTTTVVTLNVTEEITLSVADAAITMKPDITMTQDSSVTSTVWTVKTNSEAGYELKLTASSTSCGVGKALCDSSTGEGFADISTTTATTTWSGDLSADEYQFGYSGYGTDVGDGWDNGQTSCGTAGAGSFSTDLVGWAGFATTTANSIILAERDSKTGQSGATTTMCVAAEQGDNVFAPNGSYSATIIGTATTK